VKNGKKGGIKAGARKLKPKEVCGKKRSGLRGQAKEQNTAGGLVDPLARCEEPRTRVRTCTKGLRRQRGIFLRGGSPGSGVGVQRKM